MKRFIGFSVFILLIVAGLKVSLGLYLQKNLGIVEDQIYFVKKGAGLSTIASDLSKKGIIDYPRLFVKVGQLEGYSGQLKYGEYALHPKDSYRDLFEKIASGKNYKYKVTFVEGDHMYKYANQVASAGLGSRDEFLRLAKDPHFIQEILGVRLNSLEGYLYPDTYHFAKNDGEKTIIKTMVNRFIEETKSLNFGRVPLSKHEVVILASIIEKETGAGMERKLVSSVFHNRMKKKMRLQTDPTIIYGILHKTGNEISNIRKKDIRDRTAYNTYVISGLPPGPISNPGVESIKAALDPEETEFLYFVSQNDGTHVFSTNYRDHQIAVRKYQLDSRNRKGKSWRDLQKKRK